MKFGLMTVNRWKAEGHIGKRVRVDGFDVTDNCVAFNDEEGWADVYTEKQPALSATYNYVPKKRIRGVIEVFG